MLIKFLIRPGPGYTHIFRLLIVFTIIGGGASNAGESFIGGSWKFDLDANLNKLKKTGTPYWVISAQSSIFSFNAYGSEYLKDSFKYSDPRKRRNEYFFDISEKRTRYSDLIQSFSLNWHHIEFGLEFEKHRDSHNSEINEFLWEEFFFPEDSVRRPENTTIKDKGSYRHDLVKSKIIYSLPHLIDNVGLRTGITYRVLTYKRKNYDQITKKIEQAYKSKERFDFISTVRYDYGFVRGYHLIQYDERTNSHLAFFGNILGRDLAAHYDDIIEGQKNLKFYYFHGSNSNVIRQQISARQERLYNAMLLNMENDFVERIMYEYPIFLDSGWYISLANVTDYKGEIPDTEIGSFIGGIFGLHASYGYRKFTFSVLSPIGALTFSGINDIYGLSGKIFLRW